MKFHRRAATGWIALAALFACSTAIRAQQSPALPSTAEPGRVEERLRQLPQPQAPASGSVNQLELPEAAAPPPHADSIQFVFRSLTVDNAHVYTSAALTSAYQGLIGKPMTVATVYQIAADLTAKYRRDGYLLSSVVVPAQKISEGEVHLQATEGYLGSVEFEGAVHDRRAMFDAMKRRLLAERPLRSRTLERVLLLINDLPGITAQSVLRQSTNTPGASDLIVRMSRSMVSADVSADNRVSKILGPVEVQGTLDGRSLLHLEEDLAVTYLQSTDRNRLWLVSFANTDRLTASGLDLQLTGSRSRSTPSLGAALYALNLETSTDELSATLSYPILRTRATNIRVRGGLSYHDGISDSSFSTLTHDIINTLSLGATVDVIDPWHGVDLLDVEFDHGIDAFGTSRRGDPLASRLGGDPLYTKATVYLARLQSLSARWSVLLGVLGQDAFNHVLAPDEFTFGGDLFGRGYDPSEIVGDSGLAGKAEVRYSLDTPDGNGVTTYGFYDAGKVWHRVGAGEGEAPSEDRATSAGAGIRFSLWGHFSGYVEAAKPLDHVVAAEGNRDWRVFAGLKASVGF